MGEEDTSQESRREVAADDFLFHLYRGSELLQDDRVHEAKAELENALSLQPRDPKGQDLLAIVYFRLGLYPRAISIYLELIHAFPGANTPRINLALCYLKTGQPSAARAELEQVIQKDPQHARAWGYLGLAFQRMGDSERAIAAFEAGGHHVMARRLADLARPPASPSVAAPRLTSPERDVVSKAATLAYDEIDREDGSFRAELGQPRLSSSGPWAAVEPGSVIGLDRKSYLSTLTPSESLVPPAVEPSRPSPLAAPPPPLAAALSSGPAHETVVAPPSADDRYSLAPPPTAWGFAREHLLVFPRDHRVALHDTGCVLIRAGHGVAARFDAVRAISSSGDVSARPLMKKARGRDAEEPLGLPGAPLLTLDGAAEVVLGPPAGTRLFPVTLGDDTLTVREGALCGLEGDVQYESARLPNGDGDFVSMVQLRGGGTVALALPATYAAMEITEGRSLLLRVHAILGWLGRLTVRTVPPSESVAKARGLVSIAGEGMVMVDGR